MSISEQSIVKNAESVPSIKVCNIHSLDIYKTFDCGQCFRFDRVENSNHEIEFSGVAFGKFVSFAQDGKDLYIYNSTHEEFNSIWRHYLALDVDYSNVDNDIRSRSDNVSLHSAMEFGHGIRILSQDKWEAICSFIISQNNNIPRIKKIIEALSQKCGERLVLPEGYERHLSGASSLCSFPTPKAILELGIDGLIALKTGFRAKYIFDAAQKIENGELDISKVSDIPLTEDAVNYLRSVKGIGPKVASCALLFGFERYDAFPIDVWIKKVISKYFDIDDPKKFDASILGPYAGIAQQYLFYYERYGGYKEQ